MSGIGAALVRSKLLGALGLACLGFTGLMIALRWAGRELPPAPSRASLQQVRGRVVVVSPADSGIYHHPSSSRVLKKSATRGIDVEATM